MVIDKDAKPYDVHKYRAALLAGEAPHPVFCGGKDADDRQCEADAVACAFGPGRKVNPYFRAHHVTACDEGRHLSVTELPGDQGHLKPVQLGHRAYFLQAGDAGPRSPAIAAMRKPDDHTAGATTRRHVRVGDPPAATALPGRARAVSNASFATCTTRPMTLRPPSMSLRTRGSRNYRSPTSSSAPTICAPITAAPTVVGGA